MTNRHEFIQSDVAAALRRLILVILTVGMLGTAADLLLLRHFEDIWQLPPLFLIAGALFVVLWLVVSGRAVAVMALRMTMIAFIAVGCAGILLHYSGNSEFQREIDPTLAGWDLVVKVLTAKAPPALAPASMIQLGLLGLLYTYRHPAVGDESILPGSTR
jgi:hypothetical protein